MSPKTPRSMASIFSAAAMASASLFSRRSLSVSLPYPSRSLSRSCRCSTTAGTAACFVSCCARAEFSLRTAASPMKSSMRRTRLPWRPPIVTPSLSMAINRVPRVVFPKAMPSVSNRRLEYPASLRPHRDLLHLSVNRPLGRLCQPNSRGEPGGGQTTRVAPIARLSGRRRHERKSFDPANRHAHAAALFVVTGRASKP